MGIALGVIGLGRMAQAILLPLLNSGEFRPEDVFCVVGRKETADKRLDDFPKELKVVDSNDPSAIQVWKAPINLLAVKPQQFSLIAKEREKCFKNNSLPKPLLISVIAGITLSRLQKSFPNHNCVRAVPNTPALVGEGLTGLAFGNNLIKDQKSVVEKIFASMSEIVELPEDQLDSFLALTSSGPAYIALITEAMADGAVAAGLPRSLANYFAHRTLAGTASLLKNKDLHPGELKDMVASPAGTTITALRHLEKVGVRSAFMEAVLLAAERSREMS